jgi:hypothetical protein
LDPACPACLSSLSHLPLWPLIVISLCLHVCYTSLLYHQVDSIPQYCARSFCFFSQTASKFGEIAETRMPVRSATCCAQSFSVTSVLGQIERNALGEVYWRRYTRRAVYSAFESWQEATIVICMRPSCPFQTKTSSTTNVILSSLSLPK